MARSVLQYHDHRDRPECASVWASAAAVAPGGSGHGSLVTDRLSMITGTEPPVVSVSPSPSPATEDDDHDHISDLGSLPAIRV